MDRVLFQDRDVCILDPSSSGGILVLNVSMGDICKEGLLSYSEAMVRHPERGLRPRPTISHNDTIFFRAPFRSDPSTFESLFDGKPLSWHAYRPGTSASTIRVDPDNTYVYYSETRAGGTDEDLMKSRILLSTYLKTLDTLNRSVNPAYSSQLKAHMTSGDLTSVQNRMYEVIVKTPRIPPEWFVECIRIPKSGGRKSYRRRSRYRKRKTMKRRTALGEGVPWTQ
jgi:hypothetical protein